MKIQSDTSVRVVALSNLEAILERISGTAHRFYVEKVTPNRVTIGYSNPNEYGTPYPVFAHYPAYPNSFGEKESPLVVLDAVRFTGNSDDSEVWQSFEQITDCPQLWRAGLDGEWSTGYEIRVARHPEYKVESFWDKDGCIQTWHCQGYAFRSHREATEFADARMIELERQAR